MLAQQFYNCVKAGIGIIYNFYRQSLVLYISNGGFDFIVSYLLHGV
jgi:hypothetical protein